MNKKLLAGLVVTAVTVAIVGTTGIVGQVLNTGPTAEVSSNSPSYEQGPERVEITSQSSSDPDGDELRYSYDTDNDGVYEIRYTNSPIITHSFDSTGSYRVNAKVFDAHNETDTDTTVVKVNEPPTLSSLTVQQASQESTTPDGINTFRVELDSSEPLEEIQLRVTKGAVEVEPTRQDFSKKGGENSYVTRFDVAAEQVSSVNVTVEKAADDRGTSASNIGISETVSPDSDDPVVTSLSATQSSDVVSIAIEDTGAGVNESTISSGDFRLFVGAEDSRVEKNLTSAAVNNKPTETTVKLNAETPISGDEISLRLRETAQIRDYAGNELSQPDDAQPLAQASGVDAVPPRLLNVQSVSATQLRINVTDEGSGVNTTSVSGGTIDVDTAAVQSVSQVDNTETQTAQFDVTLQSPVQQSRTTVTLAELSDNNGNSHQVEQSVEIEDNAVPVIESVSVTNGKTIELAIADESSAIQSSALSASDFRVDDADVAFVTTEQAEDGVRADIELNEIQKESTQLSLVGSIPDTAGNALSEYRTSIDNLEPTNDDSGSGGGGGGSGGGGDGGYGY